MATPTSPTVLVIRDGWGRNPHPEQAAFNAIHQARTPVADALLADWPTTLLHTSGEDVGLPIGKDGPVMGNSEVGHQNIGAGRIVDQELMRITRSIRSGDFMANAALDEAFGHAESTGGRIHIIGLVSDGQVHSDVDHLLALIDFARKRGLPADRLLIHAITDGRDTPPMSGRQHVRRVEAALDQAGFPPIASVLGRFWAMDRDHRWERVQKAYDCLTGTPDRLAATADAAISAWYEQPPSPNLHGDEFIEPVAIATDQTNAARTRVKDGDSIIFFNFRGDRPREIAKAFVLDDDAWGNVKEGGFDRGPRINNLRFTGFTRYERGLPIEVVYEKPPRMPSILAEVVADHRIPQFRCAETEKFPHVTFFFNDYREDPFPDEHRVIVPSPQEVATYDLKPEMSAYGVRDAVLARLADDDCEPLIVVNFANGDMVGHTGVLNAAINACEVVDECVGEVVKATLGRKGSLIVTADHGNAEQMWNPEADCPHTAHTNYDVPMHLVGDAFQGAALRDGGRLADIAPTVLSMMNLESPEAMLGQSLVE